VLLYPDASFGLVLPVRIYNSGNNLLRESAASVLPVAYVWPPELLSFYTAKSDGLVKSKYEGKVAGNLPAGKSRSISF
jgi:hypothetical protein